MSLIYPLVDEGLQQACSLERIGCKAKGDPKLF
jgi:hypothetical protein